MALKLFCSSIKGFKSISNNFSYDLVSTGSEIWLSSNIPPCPGKCLPVACMPASFIPLIKFLANFISNLGSFENALFPIMLLVSLSTSNTGAKLMSIPEATNSLAINHPIS